MPLPHLLARAVTAAACAKEQQMPSLAPDPRMYQVSLFCGREPVNTDAYALVLDFQSRLGRVKSGYDLDSLLVSLVAEYRPDDDPGLYHLKVSDQSGSGHRFLWRLR